MRTCKLTLTADRELIKQAKKFAALHGTSVSAIFSRVIAAMTHDPDNQNFLGPLTRKASALIRLPESVRDDQLLENALVEKYGLGK